MSAASKRVPWAQLEKYIGLHQLTVGTFVDQQKNELMEIPDIEKNLPKSFMRLHEAITQILKENDILPNEEQQKVEELQLVVKTVMKLQSALIIHDSNNQSQIKSIIESMKPSISNIFGQALQK